MAMGEGEGSHGKPQRLPSGRWKLPRTRFSRPAGQRARTGYAAPLTCCSRFLFLIVAATLGSIAALPLGGGEVADDVSRGVAAHPALAPARGRGGRRSGLFVLAIVALVVLVRRQWRDARNAAAAGLAGAATAIIATIVWRAGHGAIEHAVLHGSNPSIFVVDTAFVAFVVGTDLARRSRWSRW